MTNAAVVAKATFLIRKPANEVFNAFVDPQMLTRFWLSHASQPLALGQTAHWEFMVPGASVDTYVTAMEPNERIDFAWSDGSTVSLRFESICEGTIVRVENAGFQGSPEEIVENALEATQGFTIVLCDLKTLLEQGQSMNLVRDKAWQIERATAGDKVRASQ